MTNKPTHYLLDHGDYNHRNGIKGDKVYVVYKGHALFG